jgi:diphosphomevalonate decarboxylase
MSKYTWRSPSNIALVKYWGKHGVQLPANPSISFSLDHCYTETSIDLHQGGSGIQMFHFEGEAKPSFIPKLQTFLDRVQPFLPWLGDYGLEIHSKNTFPHSSGIASSASGMSALALCLADAHANMHGEELDRKLASELARLGSGSACRSVYGGYTAWGETGHVDGSSDQYAVPLSDVHSEFMDLQDTILLIDSGEKQVSSTVGHGLMDGHPYAAARFEQARDHIGRLKGILSTGDFIELADLIEREALTLHAMMMSSDPHFMLFKGGSVSVIRRVMEIRATGEPISFTLDAGANVHLIYPATYADKALDIIRSEFLGYCQDGAYICDSVGKGPAKIS